GVRLETVELYRIAPNSAGVAPSQCCSKSAANRSTDPSCAKTASSTTNRPVSSLQPVLLMATSRPLTPLNMLKGSRFAASYVPTSSAAGPDVTNVTTSIPENGPFIVKVADTPSECAVNVASVGMTVTVWPDASVEPGCPV